MILADYKIQDSKFHIAGLSTGESRHFTWPRRILSTFLSVTAFPGYMWERRALQIKLQAISKMCVFMYVGENDRIHV